MRRRRRDDAARGCRRNAGVLARYGISRLAGRAVDYLTPIHLLALLDEPWSNIDHQLRSLLRDEIAVILREVGVTAVLVTHDREEAFSLADRIALMREGNVIQKGTPEKLYVAPSDRWAAEFVGAANFVRGHVEGDVVATPLGPLPHAASRLPPMLKF